MDELPSEIAHMVFAQLTPRDAASLRLLCRTLSVLGLEYLVPRFHLVFKSSSFEQLRQISEHPVISQHVKSLYYEADTLKKIETTEGGEEEMREPELGSEAAASADHAGVFEERGYRAYCREIGTGDQTVFDTHTEAQLRQAYQNFRRYYQDQTEIRSHDYGSEIIKSALAKFPKLRVIKLSIARGLLPDYFTPSILDREFGKGLIIPYEDKDQSKNRGVPQLRSLLLAMEHNSLDVKHLACGSIHWRFLKQDSETFEKMKKVMNTVTCFTCRISFTKEKMLVKTCLTRNTCFLMDAW